MVLTLREQIKCLHCRCGEIFFAEFVAAVPDRGAVYIEIAGDFAVPHSAEITVEDGFFAFGQVHFGG